MIDEIFTTTTKQHLPDIRILSVGGGLYFIALYHTLSRWLRRAKDNEDINCSAQPHSRVEFIYEWLFWEAG
jgi:hypothetical protein